MALPTTVAVVAAVDALPTAASTAAPVPGIICLLQGCSSSSFEPIPGSNYANDAEILILSAGVIARGSVKLNCTFISVSENETSRYGGTVVYWLDSF